MYAIWIPFQADANSDEIAAGWLHDCGHPLTFRTSAEAEIYARGWLPVAISFEIHLYDASELSLSDA